MELPPYSSDLAPSDFWLFPKRFQDLEDIRKYEDGTERHSTTGVPKNISIIGSIVGVSA
jgi:hypothetical protein